MERCKANLTPDEHKRVLDLLMQNKDVFSQSKNDIGLTHVIQHKINTGNAAAIFPLKASRESPMRCNGYESFTVT
jgi:hypothetical protein